MTLPEIPTIAQLQQENNRLQVKFTDLRSLAFVKQNRAAIHYN